MTQSKSDNVPVEKSSLREKHSRVEAQNASASAGPAIALRLNPSELDAVSAPSLPEQTTLRSDSMEPPLFLALGALALTWLCPLLLLLLRLLLLFRLWNPSLFILIPSSTLTRKSLNARISSPYTWTEKLA